MIIRLTGGLGNQMFQYAYGRSKTLRSGEALYYYFIDSRGPTKREYGLNVFNLKEKKINNITAIFLDALWINTKFMDRIVRSGYWQSEKFFISFEDEIRKDFQFTKPLGWKNIKIQEKINKTNSVSIHIRRGDYFSDTKISKVHGTCTRDYYNKAIEYINNKVKDPAFFIFSDDPEWAKNNLKIENAIYIDWNKNTDSHIDMQLMSICKHNIIANSSFSWWSAWLNKNSKKIVIAPQKWFKNSEAQKNTKNLIPKEWIRI
jgi:hypothetical protein